MATKPEMHDRLEQAEEFYSWPEPLTLRDELPPVEAFDPELLPTMLRGWVLDIAERMNCPIDLVAIPAIVAAGSLLGRRIGIRPQRHTDWLEVGNLWGCVVAPPGSMKSPAASEALAPIKRLEAKAAKANEVARAEFKAAEVLHKLVQEKATGEAKKQLKDFGPDVAKATLAAVAEPQPPREWRYFTTDATAEKLGEICAANAFGIMVYRDELLSMLDDLDNPEKAAARGFFMAGWGGQEGYTFDRIVRGTVRVPAVNLSICGTTQPNRIASYMRESLRRRDDGMVQRFQLLAWPDFVGEFREVDRHPDSEARRMAHECYQDLAELNVHEVRAQVDDFDGSSGVPFLRFSDEAQEVFSDWRYGLEHRLKSDEMSPALVAHLSKYRGLIPRLALICHLANNGIGPVSLEAVKQALGWARYLETHAVRAYASITTDNSTAARTIWRHVLNNDLPKPFTARDIQRKNWSGLSDKNRIAAGLEALCDADWLRSVAAEMGGSGGRPSWLYHANPKAMRA